MPDSDALNRLRHRLQAAMAPTAVLRANPWVDPRPMRAALKSVQQSFDAVDGPPPTPSMRLAVQAFLETQRVASFKELKYTCFGLTLTVEGTSGRLVDRSSAFQRLLGEVDALRGEDRRFRRCYQALLQSYFAFSDGQAEEDTSAMLAAPAFQTLRGFLSDRLEVVARPAGGRTPGWVITLQEHRNLLTDRPCDRYTAQLAEGKTDELAAVCQGLGVSRSSWVWQEVILAYLRDVCGRDDAPFKQAMDAALDLAEGRTALEPSLATARTVVARVVKRYSDAATHPEIPRLRDASVSRIGNPWIKRTVWDAWVRHEPARQMVDGWLKSKLMQDFFTLLSDQGGGAVDRRRLTYWLKYVKVIEDMWFVLGRSAYSNRTEEFVEMRRRMAGRLHQMTGSVAQNNAFVMKIAGHLVVEFGMTGNACFIYPASQKTFDESTKSVSIYDLKQGRRKLTHHGLTWEQEFTRVLNQLMDAPLPDLAPEPAPPSPPPADDRGQRLAEAWQRVSKLTTSPPAATAAQPTREVQAREPSPVSRHQPPSGQHRDLLRSILDRCRANGIEYQWRGGSGGSLWVAPAASQRLTLHQDMKSIGFVFDVLPAKHGYWLRADKMVPEDRRALGEPEAPAAGEPASEGEIAGILRKCDLYQVQHRDLRASGGNLWVYADPEQHPHLVDSLKRVGFQHAPGKGYWLADSREGRMTTAPASRGAQEDRARSVSPPLRTQPGMGAQDVERILVECRSHRVQVDDLRATEGQVRVYASWKQHPELALKLRAAGFKYDLKQHWFIGYAKGAGTAGRPSPQLLTDVQSARHPTAADGLTNALEAILKRCREAGVNVDDRRSRGGSIWVDANPGASPSLVNELVRIGFRFSDTRKQYYLNQES